MLTNADTVVMPSLKGQKGSLAGPSAKADEAAANARNAAAVKQPATTTMVPVGTNAAFAEASTQILPTVEPSQLAPAPDRAPPGKARVKRDRQSAEPPSRYIPGRRTTMISRLVLLAILILQAVLSLRLRNTAFEDESLYLYAGHMELQHLLHGAALHGQYSVYFSGSPVLYPVLAAALDQVGGLALARALSLVEMLAVTTLLYALTRRLFNERVGLCAAALFAVTEVRGVPGELRHLRRHLPVPARPGGLDHGTHGRVPLAGVPARRAARRAGGRGQVRRAAVRAHHRGAARAGRMARTRPPRAVVPGCLRRGRGGPAVRGAAPGRPAPT